MRGLLGPLALLLAILSFSVWNSAAMSADTERWRNQLEQSENFARAEDWPAAMETLADSYQDWSRRQTYLHIVSQHEAVDGAEGMFRRAMAFAGTEEESEFQAEISDLRDQLRLLAEMERFSLRNIL